MGPKDRRGSRVFAGPIKLYGHRQQHFTKTKLLSKFNLPDVPVVDKLIDLEGDLSDEIRGNGPKNCFEIVVRPSVYKKDKRDLF